MTDLTPRLPQGWMSKPKNWQEIENGFPEVSAKMRRLNDWHEKHSRQHWWQLWKPTHDQNIPLALRLDTFGYFDHD